MAFYLSVVMRVRCLHIVIVLSGHMFLNAAICMRSCRYLCKHVFRDVDHCLLVSIVDFAVVDLNIAST